MKTFLFLSGAIALLSVAAFFIVLAWAAHELPDRIDRQLAGLRLDLNAQMDLTRTVLSGQVEGARKDLLAKSDAQLTALRGDVFTRIDTAIQKADARIGDSLGRVDKALDDIHGLRTDLQPVLVNSAALTKDAKDSWDDLYWDVKAGVESGTVAATSIAQTSETVRDAAPKLADSAVSVGRSVDGIAKDAHREADEFVKPKSLKAQIFDYLKMAGLLAHYLF